MRESIKDLWKASWNFYKERKAQKAASICDSTESASSPIKGLNEPKESQNTNDSESSVGSAQSWLDHFNTRPVGAGYGETEIVNKE